MVRNKRVDKSWKIYKYYALYGLGIHAFGSKDIFKMKRADVTRTCKEIAATLSDEDKFIDEVYFVV